MSLNRNYCTYQFFECSAYSVVLVPERGSPSSGAASDATAVGSADVGVLEVVHEGRQGVGHGVGDGLEGVDHVRRTDERQRRQLLHRQQQVGVRAQLHRQVETLKVLEGGDFRTVCHSFEALMGT